MISNKFYICLFLTFCLSHQTQAKDKEMARAIPEEYISALVPKRIEPPRYPDTAIRKRASGWVYLEFKLSASGKPIGVTVTDSSHESMFNRSAIKAIKKSLFEIPQEYAVDTKYSYIMEFIVQ